VITEKRNARSARAKKQKRLSFFGWIVLLMMLVVGGGWGARVCEAWRFWKRCDIKGGKHAAHRKSGCVCV
jgi:hypothetical protein